MDLFKNHIGLWMEKGSLNLLKVCYSETIKEFARALALHHRPITMNFAAKFGIAPSKDSPAPLLPGDKKSAPPIAEAPHCDACGVAVDAKVVTFCRINHSRFGGKLYCRYCQPQAKQNPTCAQCGASVDDIVAAFCRFNSRRFGKRVLCRDCQNSAPVNA